MEQRIQEWSMEVIDIWRAADQMIVEHGAPPSNIFAAGFMASGRASAWMFAAKDGFRPTTVDTDKFDARQKQAKPVSCGSGVPHFAKSLMGFRFRLLSLGTIPKTDN